MPGVSVEQRPIVLTGKQAGLAGAALLIWLGGDVALLSRVGTEALDCLATDSIGSRAGAFEVIVCHPLLLGEGPLGWLAFAWIWLPLIGLAVWLRRKGGAK